MFPKAKVICEVEISAFAAKKCVLKLFYSNMKLIITDAKLNITC